jgi:hypothetical protein
MKIGVTVVFCTLVAVGIAAFSCEIRALVWHASHGFTQKWNDLEIRVPLKYEVRETSSRSVQLFVLPGYLRVRLRAPFGVISLVRAGSDAEGDEIEQIDSRIAASREKQGFRLVNTRPLEIAGTPMQCREQLANDFRSYGPASIVHCQAENKRLFASFEGSAALLNEFYLVASEIRSVHRK